MNQALYAHMNNKRKRKKKKSKTKKLTSKCEALSSNSSTASTIIKFIRIHVLVWTIQRIQKTKQLKRIQFSLYLLVVKTRNSLGLYHSRPVLSKTGVTSSMATEHLKYSKFQLRCALTVTYIWSSKTQCEERMGTISLVSLYWLPAKITFWIYWLNTNIIILLFGGSRDWTQGLVLALQALYPLSHSSSPLCFRYFLNSVSRLYPADLSLLFILPV
jgi:hypothetical protein